MQLWLEGEQSSDFAKRADRLWKSSDHDVAVVQLDDFHGQDEAISLVGMIDWILVRCSDWTMIPLENIVAAAAGSGTRIAAAISQIVDLSGAAFALQHGVDALLLPADEKLWDAAEEISGRGLQSNWRKERTFHHWLWPMSLTSNQEGLVNESVSI